ncbi:MAG TPA: hypothetical protein PKD51_18010 [Saprospiraceae bacterium]|nr:hypothetical protein [Saprospiraceae bacterium]
MRKFVFFIFMLFSINAVYGVSVNYTPQSLNCGLTTITATFSCSFSGNVLVTTTNSGVTIGSSGIMAIVNGIGTIAVTLTTSAPNPITLRSTVLTTNNSGCAAVNDFAQNTITHTCVLPINDDCNGAVSLTINIPNCTPLPYTATNATNQSGYSTCAPATYRDVWFSFTAVNTTITMSLGIIPGDFCYYSLFSNCSSSNYISCALILQSSSANLTALTVGQTYKIRLSIPSPDAGDVNICLKATSVLPVELKYFALIKSTSEYAEFGWETAAEVNLKEFVFQKSVDGLDFTDIASIEGKSNFGSYYTYTDTWLSSSQEFYYRLKILDYDGQFEYSPVLVVKPFFDNKIKVYPVPSESYISVSLPQDVAGLAKKCILIMDSSGKNRYREDITGVYHRSLNVDVSMFEKGIYYLHFISDKVTDVVQWTKM